MLIIVSYDVPSDRRRTRLAKALKDFGERVQLSVFECHLDDKRLERLKGRVAKLIDEEQDSVRLYRLCEACKGKLEILGLGVATKEAPDVYVL